MRKQRIKIGDFYLNFKLNKMKLKNFIYSLFTSAIIGCSTILFSLVFIDQTDFTSAYSFGVAMFVICFLSLIKITSNEQP